MPKTQSQPKNWQEMKLGEIAQDIRELYEPTKKEEKPYIGLEHIEQQTLQLSGIGRSSETQSTKKVFNAGDILFGTLRSYFRKVTMPKFDGVCSTDIAVIRPTEKGNGNFVKYFIANQEFIDHASNISSGTRMPRANWKILKDQVWLFPKLTEQKGIGDVLVAYDDLIENNTRRIEIVEQITQAIYTEWFVNFRFPGHEKVKMVDSGTDFGKIPEGWEVKSIGDILTVKYGKNLPKTKITESGEYPVYGAGGVIGFYTEKNVDEKTALITSRGNGSGTVWRTKGAGFVTNNSFTVVGNDKHLYLDMSLIYNSLLNANIRSSISGSAQPQVTINSLNYVQVIVPEKNLVESFQSEIYPLYILVDKLFMVNQNLSLTRDSLLPKLVTGEIRI